MLVIPLKSNESYKQLPNRFLHFASLVYKETNDIQLSYTLIKSRYTQLGTVSLQKLYSIINADPPTEVMVHGEVYIIVEPIKPAFIWYIEGAPAILVRKSDMKKFYCVNREMYGSESEYIFHKAIRDHQ